MSSLVSGHHKFCQEICEALGLPKHCRSLELNMRYDSLATVKVEYYPEEEGIRRLIPILKKYYLLEIQETKKKAVETTAMADEIRSFAVKPDDSFLEERWLAETSKDGYAWYMSKVKDSGALVSTTNAWDAKSFKTRDDCLDWIDSWQAPEWEKLKFEPVSHGFVIPEKIVDSNKGEQ